MAKAGHQGAPTHGLLLEDQIPYVLGTRPRFVIDRMGPKWKRSVGYMVRSDVRGKFDVGPMKVIWCSSLPLARDSRLAQPCCAGPASQP